MDRSWVRIQRKTFSKWIAELEKEKKEEKRYEESESDQQKDADLGKKKENK